jgi:hypothetical protein
MNNYINKLWAVESFCEWSAVRIFTYREVYEYFCQGLYIKIRFYPWQMVFPNGVSKAAITVCATVGLSTLD